MIKAWRCNGNARCTGCVCAKNNRICTTYKPGKEIHCEISISTWKYRGDNQYQNAPIKYRGDNQYQNALTVVGIEDSGSELERLPDFVTIHPLTLNREKLKGKHFVDILKNAIFK